MRTFIQHIRFSALLLPAVAAIALSCGKLQSPEGNGGSRDGDATVQIAISSAPLTKAEDGASKNAKDGDKMNNLRVWMVDGSNKVIAYASSTNTGEVTFSTDATTATVTFDNVTRGNYTLYLLANDTASLTSYVAGSTINESFTKAALSLPNSSPTYPEYEETAGMPLSLKKSISVGPGKNSISAEIVRVCGQINVTIKNRTKDKAIYITGVSLSQRSPSSGYVFRQDDHSSPTGTTQGNLASNATLTRIDPVDPTVEGSGEAKMISCYLFENCIGTDAFSLSIAGGIYGKDDTVSPTITTVTKTGYKTTGSDTNTDISTSKSYFLASASNPRQFLKADSDGNLAIEDIGTDAELFAKSDIKNYLWQFSSTSSPAVKVKNVGTNKYINISVSVSVSRSGYFWDYTYTYSASSNYSFSTSQQSISTSTSTGRQFYNRAKNTEYNQDSGYYYSYLCNNGKVGITDPSTSTSTATNTGWYLREATTYEYTAKELNPKPLADFDRTAGLTYTDSYGEIQPLTKVCRNDKVEIIVNLFYNPLTSSFDFQVEPWRTKDNQTTFD